MSQSSIIVSRRMPFLRAAIMLSLSVGAAFGQWKTESPLFSMAGKDTSWIAGQNLPAQNQALPEKRYWLAAGEVVGVDLGVWAFNRYLTKTGWSEISIQTIKDNIETGFVWDRDGYLMNQFAHPYNGAAYFNAARSNGLSFWESSLYSLGGSAIWEIAMENEPPSYNDIVNTPVTGTILGEISYRVSNLIIDESSQGFERVLREFSAFAVDPVYGVNRLFQGAMWRDGMPSDRPPFSLWMSVGGNNVFLDRTLVRNKGYGFMGFDLEYGDLLAAKSHKDPFDYFTIHAELSISEDDNIAAVYGSGVIWDTKVTLFDNPANVIGVYKEIDMIINTIYKLSATSLTSRLTDQLQLSPGITATNSLSISAILMGATNSEYASVDGKDYNIGPGASVRIGTHCSIDGFGGISVDYKRFWIHTLSGAEGEEFVGLLKIGVDYALGQTAYLGLDFMLYERYGDYRNHADTQSANSAVRLYLRFSA